MRLRINLGKGGFKGFLSQHAEKAIFGVVLALVGFFIYSSATQDVGDTGSPEELKKKAEAAKSALERDYWDAIGPERKDKVGPYPQKVGEARKPIDDKDYALASLWDKALIPKRSKRGDPNMLPPEKVEATGGFYCVAMRTTSHDDPWVDDKDAVEQPKEKPKPKRKKKKKTRNRGLASSDEEMLAGGYGSYFGAMGGDEEQGGEGMPPMFGGEGMEEESSGFDMTSAATGGRKAIGSTYRKLYIRGYQGTFGQGTTGRSLAIVAVKALVPYEKQWEEYEAALAEATGYTPGQDIPKYLYFMAERAEVPDDPNAQLDWKPISNSGYAMKLASRFAGFPKEVADPAYTVPGVLTMPIPPILLKSYDNLALHREIPRQQVKRIEPVGPTEKEQPEDELAGPGETDLSEGIASIRKGTLDRTGPGMYPAEGMSPYPTSGAEAGAGGMPYGAQYGASGMPYGAEPAVDGNAAGDESEEGGMPYGDETGEAGMPYGPGYGEGYGASRPAQPAVKYKMVRFFDFAAEPGKSYQYRVSVVLEDPNRPREPSASPDKRILEPAVVERLEKIEAEDAANKKRTFYIQTDWSEPSNIVTVAKPEQYVAGPATQGRVIPLGNGMEVQTTESKGKIVTMVWDDRRAAEVPAEREVFCGSFLDFNQDADVLQPLTLQIKTIESYHFDTDAFVADLRGGEELITDVEKTDKEKIETKYYTPGEYLVIDGKGNLLACNEIDDTEEYRRLLFIEDEKEMGGGVMQGYGMPGDQGEDYGKYEEMMQGGYNAEPMGEEGS